MNRPKWYTDEHDGAWERVGWIGLADPIGCITKRQVTGVDDFAINEP